MRITAPGTAARGAITQPPRYERVRYQTPFGPGCQYQPALKKKVAAIFASKTRAEWEEFSRAHDCCLEPVLAPEELRADPHLASRGMFYEIDSPWGALPQLKLPIAGKVARRPPPKKGEHTDEILREAGYDDATIASLRASGAAR